MLFCCASAALIGCAPERPEQFVLNETTKQLPERHQDQIRGFLEQYFGRAGDPRWMIPASPEEADSQQAASGSGAGSDAAAGNKIKLVEKVNRNRLLQGMEVYNLRCAPCHGITGDGAGEAAPYLFPKPRDYRQGIFKFTSTPRGAKPRRADLERIILYGAKGTAMPSFRWLPPDQLQAVIDYVMLLSYRGELEIDLDREAEIELEPEDDFDPKYVAEYVTDIDQEWEKAKRQVVQPAVPDPPMTDETIRKGAIAFQKQACTKCHGPDGKGGRRPDVDPNNLPKDDWGHVDFAADLTSGMLHGGRRPIDVYRRIYSGINGTPMPGFASAYQDDPETIWYLVHFILSIVEGRKFEMPQVPSETPTDEGGASSQGGGSPQGGGEQDGSNKQQGDTEKQDTEKQDTQEKDTQEKDAAEKEKNKPSGAEKSDAEKTTEQPAGQKQQDAGKDAGGPKEEQKTDDGSGASKGSDDGTAGGKTNEKGNDANAEDANADDASDSAKTSGKSPSGEPAAGLASHPPGTRFAPSDFP